MEKKIGALEAKLAAQKIAFAPVIFQVTIVLRDLGVLAYLLERQDGASVAEMHTELGISHYGLQVLLEAGYCGGVVDLVSEDHYSLSKTGHFVLKDEMTRVNMNFTQQVCYKGLFHLKEAILTGTPAGLKELGDWENIYVGLKDLEKEAQDSWFEFNHYYSDDSLQPALEIFFRSEPKRVIDVGGNTGKWAIACCRQDPDVEVTVVDLPGQIEMAARNVEEAGLQERISFLPMDMLSPDKLFPKADIIWMSQFLDCFSKEQIVAIISHAHRSMNDQTRLMIMETFWDNQKYPAAAYSLTATSVYFTAMANGDSKMYGREAFLELVDRAGMAVEKEFNEVGISHTVLQLKKK